MKVVQAAWEAWNTPMEHAIADMERHRYEAMRQADIAVLREVLDDLLVYAHSNAATDDKQSRAGCRTLSGGNCGITP